MASIEPAMRMLTGEPAQGMLQLAVAQEQIQEVAERWKLPFSSSYSYLPTELMPCRGDAVMVVAGSVQEGTPRKPLIRASREGCLVGQCSRDLRWVELGPSRRKQP